MKIQESSLSSLASLDQTVCFIRFIFQSGKNEQGAHSTLSGIVYCKICMFCLEDFSG